jgi:O-antigen ligase
LRPLDTPILLFFVFIFLDLLKIPFGIMDFQDWFKWRKFAFLLIYFPVSTQFNYAFRLRALVCSLFCVGLIIALFDIFTITSVSSIFGDNILERFVSSPFPIWTAIFTFGMMRQFLFKDLQISPKFKLLVFISFAVCVISSLAFARRTPLILLLISMIISMFFFIIYEKKNHLKISKKALIKTFCFSISIIVLLALIPAVQNLAINGYDQYKYRLKIQQIENAYIGRSSRYEVAWEIFTKNPLLGGGKASEIYFYDPRYTERRVGSIHSLYFYLLASAGITGLTLFLFLIYKIILFSFYILNNVSNRELKMYAESAIITILAMLISGITSTRMFAIESFLFLGVLLGILTNIWQYTQNKQPLRMA